MLKENPYSDNYSKKYSESEQKKDNEKKLIQDKPQAPISKNQKSKKFLFLWLGGLSMLILLLLILSQLFPQKKWYIDNDNDGYGNVKESKEQRFQPKGFVLDKTDTNDKDECIPDRKNNCKKINLVADTVSSQTKTAIPSNIPSKIKKQKKTTPAKSSQPSNNSSSITNKKTNTGVKTIPVNTATALIVKTTEIFYNDSDLDGVGDVSNFKEFELDNVPKGWVKEIGDKCPSRAGENGEGCPSLDIKIEKADLFINERIKVSALHLSEPNDKYSWNTLDADVEMDDQKSCFVKYASIGKKTLVTHVKNSTQDYSDSKEIEIFIKVPNSYIEERLFEIAEYGNFALLGKNLDNSIKVKAESAEEELKQFVKSESISVTNDQGFSSKYSSLILKLMTAVRSAERATSSIDITDVQYDNESGKIKSFHYKLNN